MMWKVLGAPITLSPTYKTRDSQGDPTRGRMGLAILDINASPCSFQQAASRSHLKVEAKAPLSWLCGTAQTLGGR